MLGLCCQYLEEQTKKNGTKEFVNILNEKALRFGQFTQGKYSTKKIEETWINNATNLYSVIQKLNKENIKVFRISSSLLPLYDSVANLLFNCQELKNILAEIGKFAQNNNMRLTMHPDQFVVISSNNEEVIKKSILMLAHHAWIFEEMNLPETPFNAINIHGGTKNNSNILIDSIQKLPTLVKNRLTLENDESSYSIVDLYKVFEETGIPICWDSHHHSFNDGGISNEESLQKCIKSWNSIKPLTHLSNTDPTLVNGSFTDRRKHSNYVHYIPDCQFQANNNDEIDIEMEFKMKNIALMKASKDFKLKLS